MTDPRRDPEHEKTIAPKSTSQPAPAASVLFPRRPDERFVRVAVERGIDRAPDGLLYAVPESLDDLQAGERVTVPLGRGDKPASGWVVDGDATPAEHVNRDRIKTIRTRVDGIPALPTDLLELARWISDYYCAPLGVTLASMVPAAVKRGIGRSTRTEVDLPGDADEPADNQGRPRRVSAKGKAVLECLAALPNTERPIEMRELASRAGLSTTAPIRTLAAAGLVRLRARSIVEATWARRPADDRVPAALTTAQTEALQRIGPTIGRGFSRHLLFGVTGSGKTEVYIRLIEQTLAAGRTALVLVPEIALTPQTSGRLVGRFPDARIAVLHSGLTAAQRHVQWRAARGEARIVMGARSAVFAPIPDGELGLIVVDEEHDSSFKQDQMPRYHGRDVAIRRAQLAGVPIVLGSATPSMESWMHATVTHRTQLVRLPERVPGVQLPRVKVVDFAAERRDRGSRRVHLIGPTMQVALERTLGAGHQAIILLNRRGYASWIACPDQRCGWVMTCDDCDVSVVYHRAGNLPTGGFVRCHHCNREQRLPPQCPDCGRRVTTFGLGTQRVEEELCRLIPELTSGDSLVRVDSDTMTRASVFHDVLGRFGRGEIRVMTGTQMIAKGLDFPNVRLVGVVNADTAINLPDFRAAERTFQLVSQVVGRCGRGIDQPGLAVVQSFHPGAPAIQFAARHDYEGFAQTELDARRGAGLPPMTRMARIVIRHEVGPKAMEIAKTVAGDLDDLRRSPEYASAGAGEILMSGPAPCSIARIAGRHRVEIELTAATAGILHGFLAAARSRGIVKPGARMMIDVDPIALM